MRQMPYFGTLGRIYTKLVCATHSCANGLVAEAVYGKGETFWQSENIFTIYGAEEKLVFKWLLR
jgi:biliverdin reductase